MRIYFAGINQIQFCESFRGRYVLESFADMRQLMDRYRPTFAGMILDSGAFTEMTTGKPVDLNAYADFVLEHGAAYEWCASLDAIKGGPDANLNNWERMRNAGVTDCVPTFHQGEPWDLLAHYCERAPRIGLGFQRPIQNARHWLSECFGRIPDGHLVHGWAMTSYTDYPFESVDSTTWLWEVKALLAVQGQGADVIRCLTNGELIDLVIRKYEREPLRAKWEGKKMADFQASLFTNTATGRVA